MFPLHRVEQIYQAAAARPFHKVEGFPGASLCFEEGGEIFIDPRFVLHEGSPIGRRSQIAAHRFDHVDGLVKGSFGYVEVAQAPLGHRLAEQRIPVKYGDGHLLIDHLGPAEMPKRRITFSSAEGDVAQA